MLKKILKQRIETHVTIETENKHMGIKTEENTLLILEPAQAGPRTLDTSFSITSYGVVWVPMGVIQSEKLGLSLHVAF